MNGLETLHHELTLPHEWQLGAGGRIRWTPPAPAQVDRPGFRDPGSYWGHALEPVFAVTLLDEHARPIELVAGERNWNPARLELKYHVPQALLTERRTVLSLDAFVSHWTLSHAAELVRRFWIVLWTRRPDRIAGRALSDVEANPQGISFQESVIGPDGREMARWGCALGASFDADSWSVNGAQSAGLSLDWPSTPFFDLMAPGGLPGHLPSPDSQDSQPGYLYMALAYPFEIPPGERLVLTLAMALAGEVEAARAQLERSVSLINPIQAAEEEWINWFEEVPAFSCSDPSLQRVYWYRWAMQRLWSAPLGTEGDAAQSPVSADRLLAAAIEGSWLQSGQRGYEQLAELARRDPAALADVPIAHAMRKVMAVHPDRESLSALRPLVVRNGAACPNDPPHGPAPEPWHRESNGQGRPSLARAVFHYDSLQLWSWLGSIDPDYTPDPALDQRLEHLASVIRQTFWDESIGFYFQWLPAVVRNGSAHAGEDRPAKTIAGFYPLLASLAAPEQRHRILEHLYDPEEFWTQCPIPTLSRDDPEFSADGHWRNQRLDRPWHGRVWPAATSLVVDALGQGIEQATASQRLMFAELLHRVIAAAFVTGLERPAFHEHYNPLTGRPAVFLGRGEGDGGWLLDHLIRYVVGVRPDPDGRLVVDPLPTRLEWFHVRGIVVGHHELEVEWDHRAGLSVRVDDQPSSHAPVGQSLALYLPDHWESE